MASWAWTTQLSWNRAQNSKLRLRCLGCLLSRCFIECSLYNSNYSHFPQQVTITIFTPSETVDFVRIELFSSEWPLESQAIACPRYTKLCSRWVPQSLYRRRCDIIEIRGSHWKTLWWVTLTQVCLPQHLCQSKVSSIGNGGCPKWYHFKNSHSFEPSQCPSIFRITSPTTWSVATWNSNGDFGSCYTRERPTHVVIPPAPPTAIPTYPPTTSLNVS